MDHCSPSTTGNGRILLTGRDAVFRRQLDRVCATLTDCERILDATTWTALPDQPASLVVFDLDDAQGDSFEMLQTLSASPGRTVIAVTSNASVNLAVDAMRHGADDFIVKPVSDTRLREALENADNTAVTQSSAPPSQVDQNAGTSFQAFVGESDVMGTVYRTIRKAASSTASVFIQGESGTGKELCAEAIHALSPRADGPMISLNCSAIPRDLMESEIFGHEKGAFTGASGDRDGAAQAADGGTLFLDEICEMDLSLQAKLLRFIQTGSVTKVGGNIAKKVDVRFVCATNKSPQAAVHSGQFRADLFYRLHVLPIALPPLRDRHGDAIAIAESTLVSIAREEGRRFHLIDDSARALIGNYHWPGNVRELLNVLRNVVVMNDEDVVTGPMLALALAHGSRIPVVGNDCEQVIAFPAGRSAGNGSLATMPGNTGQVRPLWEQERDIIESAIASCGGNIVQAAAKLGVNPSTIYRKRQSWAAGAA